ncbi:MAG: Tim44-like domain-containing protein [Burkholderiales bacterium]|nr:Tim44-like domain-containing protein [Burkholderiales bacterium]
MKSVLAAVFAAVMVIGLFPADAEARRLGGARNLGAQRQALPPQKPAAPAASQAPAAAAGAPAAAKAGAGRWLAPLAGLAAGLGLAYLFGEQLGTIVLAILLGLAVVLALGLVMRALGRGQAQGAPRGLQYAGLGNETVAAPPPSQLPAGGALPEVPAQSAPSIPAGFDVPGFLRQAKKSFIALQAANDRGDLESIRDLVTDELFDDLAHDVAARKAASQATDVVTLDAQLLEVTTEAGAHWASIRFSGMLREDAGGAPVPFEEVWNLQKPEKGGTGWLLAGIQQVN